MKEYANNPIVKHAVEFALMVIKYTESLEEKRKFIIAKQLLRCGTSIGANVLEAQSAESKMDFIHKMKIADKERVRPGIGCIYVNTPKDMFCIRI